MSEFWLSHAEYIRVGGLYQFIYVFFNILIYYYIFYYPFAHNSIIQLGSSWPHT